MRLREVKLTRYRQFVDERMRVDPNVTVIVGRNGAGKTGLLERFFDQYVYEGVLHGSDHPRFLGRPARHVAYSLTWECESDDCLRFPLEIAFGRTDVRSIEVDFDSERPDEMWRYRADDEPVAAYERRPQPGTPVLRQVFLDRQLFPKPHFIRIGDRRLIPNHFEARFYELPPGTQEVLRIRDWISLEALLLRIAGFRADTRHVRGKGTEEPWDTAPKGPTPAFGPGEVNRRLAAVAKRITSLIRLWWDEPSDLTFRLRLVSDNEFSYRINSHLFEWSTVDQKGAEYHGAGLSWFIAFLVELLYVEDQTAPLFLVFDEPAAPLHPGMQKRVATLLDALSAQHQVIYSTHSPFLIDWSAPQRLRVLERTADTTRTRINNRPHAGGQPLSTWDVLRHSIGITLGDVVGLSTKNLFVEGVTDQIILAAASRRLRARGQPALDLTETSILPYGEEPALKAQLAAVRARGYSALVIVDGDSQGRKVEAFCMKSAIACLSLGGYAESGGPKGAIEDVIGVEEYVRCVNAFYTPFGWFSPLDPALVAAGLQVSDRTLANVLDREFRARFEGRPVDKVAVATELANAVENWPGSVIDRLERLFGDIRMALA